MDELIQAGLDIVLHPTVIAFVLGGIISVIFVVGTAYYYNRRGRGG